MRTEIDVEELLDRTGITRTTVTFVSLAFFIILFDGFDLAALSYAAPHIAADWAIGSKAALGVAFSASLVGMLVGAPVFGLVADRRGRKFVIVLCCLTMGLPTLAIASVHSLNALLLLRFVTGIGLGGAAPCLIALTAEFAPRRHRATVVTVMYTGISLGAALAGAWAAWVVPALGWRTLFLVGGAFPLVFGVISAVWMPESLKFLATRYPDDARTRTLAASLGGAWIGPDTVLVVQDFVQDGARAKPGLFPRDLFVGRLAFVTPLLWVSKVSILMAYYCVTSWLPTLLGALHLAIDQAATASIAFQIGGALGGLALGQWIDRRGLAAVALFFAFGIPGVCLIGYVAHWGWLLLAVTFVAGFCVMGVQYGLNAISAMVYPTALRTYGVGWSTAVSRLGAIAGPMLGAASLEAGLPIEMTIASAVFPLLLGALSSFGLARMLKVRMQPSLPSLLPSGVGSAGS